MADNKYVDVLLARGVGDGSVRLYKVETSTADEGDVIKVKTPSGALWAVVEARLHYASEEDIAFWENIVFLETDEVVAVGKMREVKHDETV